MNKVLALSQPEENLPSTQHFNHKQIDILKNSICKGISNDEFEVFLMACSRTQLDPFMKQIYAIPRKMKKPDGTWTNTITIQTSIDGYRLIAERTGCYAPGAEPTYTHDANGNLVSATSYIKKQTKDGTWHTVSASAYSDEYMQTFTDKQSGEKRPTGMWVNMPRTMLAKCAEAQALRKAFPAEMSGVYTKEEMQQADFQDITPPAPIMKISQVQADELKMILDECDVKYQAWVYSHLLQQYKTDKLSELPLDIFERMKKAALKNMEETHTIQKQQALIEPEVIIEDIK